MPDSTDIRVICFDLGGVIVRICDDWADGCARAGLPVREGAPFGVDQRHFITHVDEYQTGRLDTDTYAARMSHSTNGAYTPDEIMAVHHAWMFGEYEGMDALIDRLHDLDFATAALSNTNEAHWTLLNGPGYDTFQRLRRPLASHLLGLHKPDPAIYRAAEAEFGHAGASIVFFDDLEENVAGARDAGWHAWRIDPTGDPAVQVRAALGTVGIEL